MNFKYGRPKASRAGCLMCKPHKFTGEEKAKYEDPPDAPRKPRGKKNRRKWCRGRVGVAHKPRWVPDPDHNSIYLLIDEKRRKKPENEYQIYECETCGKHLGWRTLHLACGQIHTKWGYGYHFKDRITGKYVRKPYPCEEKAA